MLVILFIEYSAGKIRHGIAAIHVRKRVEENHKGKNTPHVDDCFMPRKTPGAQPSLKSVLQNKQIVENYDKAIEECLAKDVVQTF